MTEGWHTPTLAKRFELKAWRERFYVYDNRLQRYAQGGGHKEAEIWMAQLEAHPEIVVQLEWIEHPREVAP